MILKYKYMKPKKGWNTYQYRRKVLRVHTISADNVYERSCYAFFDF